MESESKKSQGKFPIGGGLSEEQQKMMEDSKKSLQQQESVGGISADQAIPIKEGAGVGVTRQTKEGGESWFRAGAKNAPEDLNKYDRPGKKDETEEGLLARLLKARAEKNEEKTRAANEATRGLSENPRFIEKLGQKMVEDTSRIVRKPLSVAEELENSFNNKKETLEMPAGEDEDETKEEKIKEEKNELARDLAATLKENERVERLKTEDAWLKEAEAEALKSVDETLALEKKLEKDIKSAEEEVSASKKEGGAGSAELKELESKLFRLEDNLRKLHLEKKLKKEVKSVDKVIEVKIPENLEKNSVSEEKEKEPTSGEEKYIKSIEGEVPPEVMAEVRERINNINKTLDTQAGRIDKEAEDKGYLDVIRTFGRNWKEVRLTYKIALPLAVLAGISSGGVAALLGVSIGVASRIGIGAAAFVGSEAFLEKKRREKERWWNKYPKTMAAIPAIIMSGAIGKMVTGTTEASEWLLHTWDNVFGGAEVAQTAVEQPPPDKLFSGFDVAESPTTLNQPTIFNVNDVQTEAVIPPVVETIHKVVSGDNLHNIIGGMKELNDLDGGRKENTIANIIAKIGKNSIDYGIASGNVDNLAIGDSIDMEKIHQAFENTKISGGSVIDHAQKLTDTEVFDIDKQRIALLDWREAHLNEPLTTEKTSEILQKVVNLNDGEGVGKTYEESIINRLGDVGNIGEIAELPSGVKEYIENTVGLDNTEWQKLRGETVDDFLDILKIEPNNLEGKLDSILTQIIEDTEFEPEKNETILEFLKRAGQDWSPK